MPDSDLQPKANDRAGLVKPAAVILPDVDDDSDVQQNPVQLAQARLRGQRPPPGRRPLFRS